MKQLNAHIRKQGAPLWHGRALHLLVYWKYRMMNHLRLALAKVAMASWQPRALGIQG
jgi:hypothetical protein